MLRPTQPLIRRSPETASVASSSISYPITDGGYRQSHNRQLLSCVKPGCCCDALDRALSTWGCLLETTPRSDLELYQPPWMGSSVATPTTKDGFKYYHTMKPNPADCWICMEPTCPLQEEQPLTPQAQQNYCASTVLTPVSTVPTTERIGRD